MLKNVNGLAFTIFDEGDVVRHHLVQRIVRAYDEHKTRVAEQQMLLLAEPKNLEAAAGGEKQAAALANAAGAPPSTNADKSASAEAKG